MQNLDITRLNLHQTPNKISEPSLINGSCKEPKKGKFSHKQHQHSIQDNAKRIRCQIQERKITVRKKILACLKGQAIKNDKKDL